MAEKKLIRITAGEEYNLHRVDYKEWHDTFLSDLFEQADIQLKQIADSHSLKNADSGEFHPNIIAFCGKSGSGKSSAMISYADWLAGKGLPENDNDLNKRRKATFNDKTFSVLRRINPSQLEEHEDIITEVLAYMLHNAEEHIKEKKNEKVDAVSSFIIGLREIVATINSRKAKKDIISEQFSDEITGLVNRSRNSDLRSKIVKIVESYKSLMEYGKDHILVIPIDDIDLNLKIAFEVAEDVRKYLSIPGVVVLIAFDPKILHLAIAEHMAESAFQLLELNDPDCKNVIEKSAWKFLDKFIPYSRRIYLPKLDEDFQLTYDGLNLGNCCYCDLKTTIKALTGDEFLSKAEHPSFELPENIRKLCLILGFLNSLKKEKEGEENNNKEERLKENHKRFEALLEHLKKKETQTQSGQN